MEAIYINIWAIVLIIFSVIIAILLVIIFEHYVKIGLFDMPKWWLNMDLIELFVYSCAIFIVITTLINYLFNN